VSSTLCEGEKGRSSYEEKKEKRLFIHDANLEKGGGGGGKERKSKIDSKEEKKVK